MICKNCGTEIEYGTRFCGNCGARIVPENIVDNTPKQPAPQEYVVPTPQEPVTPVVEDTVVESAPIYEAPAVEETSVPDSAPVYQTPAVEEPINLDSTPIYEVPVAEETTVIDSAPVYEAPVESVVEEPAPVVTEQPQQPAPQYDPQPAYSQPTYSQTVYPQPNNYQPVANEPHRKAVFSILSLVLGLIGLVLGCCPVYGMYVSWLFAIAGIALGIVDRCVNKSFNGMSITGIVTGAIGLLLIPLLLIIFLVFGLSASNM